MMRKHELELAKIERGAPQPAAELMAQIRVLGKVPRQVKGAEPAHIHERLLFKKLCRSRKAGQFRPEDESELIEMEARSFGPLQEAEDPPDPLDPFADEAENRLEQDLLMMSHGLRSRPLLRRVQRYKMHMNHPALQEKPLVRQYKEQVNAAASSANGMTQYVAGIDIDGDALREFSALPLLCGPLVCQLCEADFLYDADFAKHQDKEHGGQCEYRKRVLYLMEQNGCHPITAQEKRLMVQNFAFFQQFSRPGSNGNTFSRSPEVSRCEAACALCQQKDFIEYRYKLSLFGTPPPACERASAAPQAEVPDAEGDPKEPTSEPARHDFGAAQHALVKRGDIYYIQSPDRVHALLDVERYAARWPLIPPQELHASSVQHPANSEWRWLLHVRRVPTAGVPQPADPRPPCAGVGDEAGLVFACWDCLVDMAAKKPKMPLNACVNDK